MTTFKFTLRDAGDASTHVAWVAAILTLFMVGSYKLQTWEVPRLQSRGMIFKHSFMKNCHLVQELLARKTNGYDVAKRGKGGHGGRNVVYWPQFIRF
jgi:hypothetical protein